MSDLISRQRAIKALQELNGLKQTRIFNDSPYQWIDRMFLEAEDILKNLPSAEPERTAKVTDTWKVGGSDELNAWCPECEHRITRGCSYCPTCGAKLEWSE